MRVLVTGANGFIGRHVCARLIEKGIEVRAAVRNRESAQSVVCSEIAEVGELNASTDWSHAVERMDAIIHTAGLAHLKSPGHDGEQRLQVVNRDATEALAHAARRASVGRLVLLSTAKVYGDSSVSALGATTPPAPSDAYAQSKLEGENAVRMVLEDDRWTIIRPPLVYGPGVRANFLALMRAVRRGIPLPLSSINNCRSMVFVKNLADALCFVSQSQGAAGRILPVSDGEDLSTPELLRRMAAAMGKPARLFGLPSPVLHLGALVAGRRLDLERLAGSFVIDSSAIAALGWHAPWTMQEGLTETAAWLQNAQQPPS